MGQSQSSVHSRKFSYEKKVQKLGKEFTMSKFINVRHSSSIVKERNALKNIGIFLNKKLPESISKKELSYVGLIVVNTYKSSYFRLGVGPINDAYITANNLHRRGYKIFFLHNSTRDEFLTFCKYFIQNTKDSLTIFYAGRTTVVQGNIPNEEENGNKIFSCMKAMVFENGYVIDHEIGTLLTYFKPSYSKIIFMTESHGTSIFDFNSSYFLFENLPSNIISISVDNDNEKITEYDKLLQTNDGIFTLIFWRIENEFPSITLKQLDEKIGPNLNRFGLSFIFSSTSKDLETMPILI